MAAISGAACQQTDNTTTGNNTSPGNTSAKTAPAQTEGAAPVTSDAAPGSPTAAYHAAYQARKNKDIPTLRGLLSKDILEFFELIGSEEKKSIDDMLGELAARPQADKAEVRNEKINGDKATIEYLDENGKWSKMGFVKEDGEWKLTLDTDDPEPASSGNSNPKVDRE